MKYIWIDSFQALYAVQRVGKVIFMLYELKILLLENRFYILIILQSMDSALDTTFQDFFQGHV